MSAPSIRGIIFDFGGVLINWDPHKLFNKYFANDTLAVDAFLDEIHFFPWNLSQDKGYPFSQAVTDLSAQFPQYAHLIHAYDEEWEQSITGTIQESVNILEKLKTNGYPLYGLTNWSAEKFYLVRYKYAFFELFDDIVVSGDVKLIKPDPAIFYFLLKKIRRQAEECLIVDDTIRNLEVAKEMGFMTIHFTSPTEFEYSLREIGVL